MENGDWWRECMRPLSKDKKMCCVPRRSRTVANGERQCAGIASIRRLAGTRLPGGDEGSYAPNGWMCNIPLIYPDVGTRPCGELLATHMVKGADNVPVFTEGWWVDGWPNHLDNPAPDGEKTPTLSSDEMQRLCVNRHGGGQFCLFADWSVRKSRSSSSGSSNGTATSTSTEVTKAGGVTDDAWPAWMAASRIHSDGPCPSRQVWELRPDTCRVFSRKGSNAMAHCEYSRTQKGIIRPILWATAAVVLGSAVLAGNPAMMVAFPVAIICVLVSFCFGR